MQGTTFVTDLFGLFIVFLVVLAIASIALIAIVYYMNRGRVSLTVKSAMIKGLTNIVTFGAVLIGGLTAMAFIWLFNQELQSAGIRWDAWVYGIFIVIALFTVLFILLRRKRAAGGKLYWTERGMAFWRP